jgi:cytidine deaminase
MSRQELVDLAIEARQKAYAPYSRYKVGAALLGKSGKIYLGCNVEIASYGLTCCAERTAIFQAVSEGEQDFEAIAVATTNGVAPCGACRQVLSEFAPDLIIYTANLQGRIKTTSIKKLLPSAFTPDDL